jgi:hypothetical protein
MESKARIDASGDGSVRELAFYYPNPMWTHGDWIKNLILFFDGIALLVPNYMKDRPEEIDPAIVVGLREYGLLEIIEPELAVNKAATEKLVPALAEIVASGMLDGLAKHETAFHELSMSRLGYFGDRKLAEQIFQELKKRGLAKDSEDTVSIPMHPIVRSLVLVLLAQILRPYGSQIGARLNPATDNPKLVDALAEVLGANAGASAGQVVAFDLNTVGADLGPIPLGEVLAFRRENLEAHRRYMLSARKFAYELSRMSADEQRVALELREVELADLASDLRKRSRKAWKKPSSFALSLVAAALSAAASPLTALLRAASVISGYDRAGKVDAGSYSYLFRAQSRYPW